MNPFSARYFLLMNKVKVLSIILMTSMISLAYIGGLYLTNISEESMAIPYDLKDFVRVRSSMEDINHEQLGAFLNKIQSDTDIELLHTGINSYYYKTMLGFRNGDRAYSFTKKDFTKFNQKIKLIPSNTPITNNTLLLSNKEAAYLKVKTGDQYSSKDTEDINIYFGNNPFEVIVFDREVFSAYFVVEDVSYSNAYLLTWKENYNKEAFFQRIEEFKSGYSKVEFITYKDDLTNLKKNFDINNIIYYSIIAIISIVFAITVNAVLVGLYDKRRQEFAVYLGMGIKTTKIYRKIALEIIIINGLGLFIAGLLSILAVSILNEYVYFKEGMRMWYYHRTALLAVILCDLTILIPSIGLRLQKISQDFKQPEYL